MPVNTDWTRSPQTVTIDTRGINCGTPEGQAAVTAAMNIIRESDGMGCSTSPEQARSFNYRAQQVAAQVDSVRTAHQQRAAKQASSDAFIRNLVASWSRR